MHFLILGQQRFGLPIGETRIGGSGKGAAAFPELAALAPMASIVVEPGGPARLLPVGRASRRVTVDGTRLRAAPVVLRHGAIIGAAGMHLFFAELRELRTATDVMSARPRRAASRDGDQTGVAVGTPGWLASGDTGVIAAIPNDALVIGRGPDSDLVIPSRDVSRRHAVIRRAAEGYVLRDLSTNGTFVNGERVDGSHALSMGDVIGIGGVELRFEVDLAASPDGAEATSPAPRSLPQSVALEPPTGPRAPSSRRNRMQAL